MNNMLEMLYQMQTIKSLKTKTIFTDLLNPDPGLCAVDMADKRPPRTFNKPIFGFSAGANQFNKSSNRSSPRTHYQPAFKQCFTLRRFKTALVMNLTNPSVTGTTTTTTVAPTMNSEMFNFTGLIEPVMPFMPSYMYSSRPKAIGDLTNSKFKVMMRLFSANDSGISCIKQNAVKPLAVDRSKRYLTVGTSSDQETARQYTFDHIFTKNDFHSEVCNSILSSNDLLNSVLDGTSACIFTIGQSATDKSNTMFGTITSLGIAPLSICFLYDLIEKSNQQVTLQVSAVEINDCICVDVINQTETAHIQDVSKHTCVNKQDAMRFLDKALNQRSFSGVSHMLLSLHLEQLTGVSQLHLIDFGHLPNESDTSAQLSIQQLGHVIKCVLTEQSPLPYGENMLTKLVSLTMGSIVTMVPHVNEDSIDINEALQIIQLSSKISRKVQSIRPKEASTPNKTIDFDANKPQLEPTDSKGSKSNNMLIQQYNSLSISPIKLKKMDTNNNRNNTNNNNNNQLNSTLLPDLADKAKPRPSFKSNQIKLGVQSFKQQKPACEVWIDGPKSDIVPTKPKILTPSSDLNLNEIWIDGPNANLVTPANLNSFEQISTYFNVIRDRYTADIENTKSKKRHQQQSKSESTESLTCLDRQLLRQLNEHDATIENVFRAEAAANRGAASELDADSRPISLLSFHSTQNDTESLKSSTISNAITTCDTQQDSDNSPIEDVLSDDDDESDEASLELVAEENNYKQKLAHMKQASECMKPCKEMASLQKTLETFLSMNQQQNLIQVKPVSRTVLTPATDLTKLFQQQQAPIESSEREVAKRLSRILSPTFERPEITRGVKNHPKHLSISSIGSSLCSTSASNSSANSSSSQSPNSSCTSACNQQQQSNTMASHVIPPLLHSSPIQQKLANLESTNIETFDMYSEPFDTYHDKNNNRSQLGRFISPVRPSGPVKVVDSTYNQVATPTKPKRQTQNQNQRLFFNFNNNNHFMIDANTPENTKKFNQQQKRQQQVNFNSVSVPSSPSMKNRSSSSSRPNKQNQFQTPQPVIKILKQTAHSLLTGGASTCTGNPVNHNNQLLSHHQRSESTQSLAYEVQATTPTPRTQLKAESSLKKESILNRLFRHRPKSKDVKAPTTASTIPDTGLTREQTFSHHQSHITLESHPMAKNKTNTCFGLSSSSSASSTSSAESYSAAGSSTRTSHSLNQMRSSQHGVQRYQRLPLCEQLSSSGYESFANEGSQNGDGSESLHLRKADKHIHDGVELRQHSTKRNSIIKSALISPSFIICQTDKDDQNSSNDFDSVAYELTDTQPKSVATAITTVKFKEPIYVKSMDINNLIGTYDI